MQPTSPAPHGFTNRFSAYFGRDIAERAASSLRDSAEIELRITGATPETFTFKRNAGKNLVVAGTARDPQMTFTLTADAAEVVLSDVSTDIGSLGVGILKLVASSDPTKKVELRVHAGVLSLLGKGYFGVLATGGSGVASFMASRGLGGLGAIKNALKKLHEGK